MTTQRRFWLVPRSTYDLAFILYYGMRLFVAVAFGIFLWQHDWASAFYTAIIFLLMVTPAFLKRQYRLFLPFELDLAVVGFVFFTLFLGSLNNFYELFPWWDKMLHFSSGLISGFVGFVLVYMLNDQRTARLNLTPGFIAFFSFSFSLAVAVAWEIYEYFFDLVTNSSEMQGMALNDTMEDLIVCTVGAGIVAFGGYLWMHRRQKVPLTPRLLRGFQYKGKEHTGEVIAPKKG